MVSQVYSVPWTVSKRRGKTEFMSFLETCLVYLVRVNIERNCRLFSNFNEDNLSFRVRGTDSLLWLENYTPKQKVSQTDYSLDLSFVECGGSFPLLTFSFSKTILV